MSEQRKPAEGEYGEIHYSTGFAFNYGEYVAADMDADGTPKPVVINDLKYDPGAGDWTPIQ